MRKWCVVLTAVVFACLVSGCADNGTKKETEKAKETSAEIITEVQTEVPAVAVIETEVQTEVPAVAVIETEAETEVSAEAGTETEAETETSVVTFSESDLLRADDYGVIAYSYSEGNDAAQFAGNPTYPMVCYGLETGVLSDYEVAVNSSETVGSQVYGIPIPSNATTLHITLPDTTGTKIRLCNISYHDSESLQTSVAGVTACKYVGFETYDNTSFGDSGTTLTIDLTSSKPSEADSICLYVQADSGTAQDISDPITIEFS